MAEFPPVVLDFVCDPGRGLAIQQNFLPSVFEVREACISHFNLLLAIWHNEQIPEERRLKWSRASQQFQIEESRENRPTKEELLAKYGPNYGISTGEEATKRANETVSLGDIIAHYTKNGLGIPLHRPMKEESNGQDYEKGVMADAVASGSGAGSEERQANRRLEAAAQAGGRSAPSGAGEGFHQEAAPPREEGDPGPA